MRKGTRKSAGDKITAKLMLDIRQMKPSREFIACLKDAPGSLCVLEEGEWIAEELLQ
jgi:hypothetical protein